MQLSKSKLNELGFHFHPADEAGKFWLSKNGITLIDAAQPVPMSFALKEARRAYRIMSNPYADCAGFVEGRQTGAAKGWVVIYLAKEQGMSEDGGKYVISCETHHCCTNSDNIKTARQIMQAVDFCEDCMKAKRS